MCCRACWDSWLLSTTSCRSLNIASRIAFADPDFTVRCLTPFQPIACPADLWLFHYPALDCLSIADVVVGGAGYNTVAECEALGVWWRSLNRACTIAKGCGYNVMDMLWRGQTLGAKRTLGAKLSPRFGCSSISVLSEPNPLGERIATGRHRL